MRDPMLHRIYLAIWVMLYGSDVEEAEITMPIPDIAACGVLPLGVTGSRVILYRFVLSLPQKPVHIMILTPLPFLYS